MLTRPIYSGYRWCHKLFAQRKDSYSLHSEDGVRFRGNFSKNCYPHYVFRCKELFARCQLNLTPISAQINLWSEWSPSELEGPDEMAFYRSGIHFFIGRIMCCEAKIKMTYQSDNGSIREFKSNSWRFDILFVDVNWNDATLIDDTLIHQWYRQLQQQ